MTDNNIIDTRPTSDETKEIRSRVSRLSQNKFKTDNKYSRKQTRSPSVSALLYHAKDVGTPKHRSRIIFNDCSNGDSPSEPEGLQDIIWDPASPPPVRNGKRARGSGSIVEISELVNRIAPNDEKSMDKDSVLQWIGDTAIPCTPEIQQPRIRRCSARRQSNNVEDLMKLAKQFDLNMTHQHKEMKLEMLQNSKGANSKDLHKLNKFTATYQKSESNEKAKGLSHEEELHALFDGPTQHLSGRLSPPSTICSQESRTEKTTTHGMRPSTSDSENLPQDAQVSALDFDDDWENDDLLSDLFVLEVTKNPWLLSSCTAKIACQIGSAASRKCEPTMAASSFGSSSRSGCPQSHQNTIHYTRISSKTCTNPSNTGPVQSGIIKELHKTDSGSMVSECQKASALGRKQEIFKTSVCSGAKDFVRSAGASGKDLDSLWGDGDDDDLLYQACDDLERISAIQEQQRDKNSTKASDSSPEVPSSIITTSSSSMSRNSRAVRSQHPTENKQPVCVFARSHSIPGASGIQENKQKMSDSANASQVIHYLQNSREQYHFTQLSHDTGPSGENLFHSTFKRHQSDPGALKKVQSVVKCSAAEIEKKKQEAIARRRLRLQANQKLGTPT